MRATTSVSVTSGRAWTTAWTRSSEPARRPAALSDCLSMHALDLRREHRLLAHVGVEEEGAVGQEAGHAVQPAQSKRSPLDERLQRTREPERRTRGQRVGDESPHGLPRCGADVVVSGKPPPHGISAALRERT